MIRFVSLHPIGEIQDRGQLSQTIYIRFCFQNAVIPTVSDYRLLDYNFNDLNLDDDGTVKASIRMFMELDLLDKFRIDYEVKIKFKPPHDKTNKLTARPAKTQISLGIRPV